ncbi:unnamed protein product [Arabidopsis halleri]
MKVMVKLASTTWNFTRFGRRIKATTPRQTATPMRMLQMMFTRQPPQQRRQLEKQPQPTSALTPVAGLNMEEARVDGALIVQPINHKFDHSLVTSVLKKYPSKFVGCCLANPAEDGSAITHLENLVLESNYRAVRFDPYLWPLGQKMTNPVGKALFSKAGELGVPVGFMCMKCSDQKSLPQSVSYKDPVSVFSEV